MKYVKLYEWTPKQSFEPHIDHKNSPIGPQKVKTTQFEPDPNLQNSLFFGLKIKKNYL